MTKEEYILMLQVLTEAKESREIKKLKDKISIFVERFNLDENYQKNMMDLAERLKALNPEDNEN